MTSRFGVGAVRALWQRLLRLARGPRSALAILALGCGSAYTVFVIGARALDPTDISWLRADALAEYLGWAFLRQDPVTALPLTFTDRVGYPLTVSIAHVDVVPLLAIALLPLSRFLPDDFQYFGPFQCVGAGALFYLGYRLARLYSPSVGTALAAGTFLMTNSVFTRRLGIHTALTAQCLLVWPVYEFLKRFRAHLPDESGVGSAASARSGFAIGVAGVAFTLGINPYIAVMAAVFVVAYGVRLVISQRRAALRYMTATCTIAAGGFPLWAWFLGYFGRAEGGGGPGLGAYSANLNTFVNPVSFSRFLRGLPIVSQEQIEGAAYLGLSTGVMVAGALVVTAISPRWRAELRRMLPLFVASAIAFAFSLSNRITLGASTILEIPVSPPLLDVLSFLRTSGRLAWPLYYLLVIAAIAFVAVVFPLRVQAPLLVLLVVVQVFEFSPLRAVVKSRAALELGAPAPLVSDAFRRLGEKHQHLVVLPAWQCGFSKSPGGLSGYSTFGLLAAGQHMTINSYYSGRYGERALRVHCVSLPEDLEKRGPSPDTAYVVDEQFLSLFQARAWPSHECGDRDSFHLCVKRGALY
jgi:hypothetical protein